MAAKSLTETQFPWTGPLYGPSHSEPASKNRSTVKGLKRAMIRLGYLEQELGSETDDFGGELEKAFKTWWADELDMKGWTLYGRGSWLGLRQTKLTQGPNRGDWAMDAKALAYVREDALKMCYPHPAGAPKTYVGQGLHQTDGLPWPNWAIDFMAPGGTKVLAVENATVTRLSGNSPSSGANQAIGIFGWTIYYVTPAGYSYFSTHYGRRLVTLGQTLDCGQVIGEVGHWPGDEGRSHTHLGVTSPHGPDDAKKHILEISKAQRVVA